MEIGQTILIMVIGLVIGFINGREWAYMKHAELRQKMILESAERIKGFERMLEECEAYKKKYEESKALCDEWFEKANAEYMAWKESI